MNIVTFLANMDNLGVKQRCFFARLWSFLAVFNWYQTRQGCHHSSTTRCVSMLFNLFQGTPFRKAIALLISFNAALLGHFMAEMSKAPVKPVSAPEGRALSIYINLHQIAQSFINLHQSTLQINDYKSWLHIVTLQIYWLGGQTCAGKPTPFREDLTGQRWSTFYWNWSNHINITMKSSKTWNQWWFC